MTGGLQTLVCSGDPIQLVSIEALRCFSSLWSLFGLNSDVEFRDNQAVVCPAFYTTHCPDHSEITSFLSPGDDVVNQMPVHGVRVPPRYLAAVLKVEDCVSDK